MEKRASSWAAVFLVFLTLLLLAGRTFEIREFFVKSGEVVEVDKNPSIYALRQGNETQALFTTIKRPDYMSFGLKPEEGKRMHLLRLALRWKENRRNFMQLDLYW